MRVALRCEEQIAAEHALQRLEQVRHDPEVSLEVVEVETLLILQENLFDFLLELGVPVSRWVFSVPDLLQQIFFVHLRLEI